MHCSTRAEGDATRACSARTRVGAPLSSKFLHMHSSQPSLVKAARLEIPSRGGDHHGDYRGDLNFTPGLQGDYILHLGCNGTHILHLHHVVQV